MVYSLYKRFILLVYAWLMLIAIQPLKAHPVLTLEEVIQLVLKNNFDILTAQNEQQIATQNHHIGKAGFLPRLDMYLGSNDTRQTWPQGISHTNLSTDFSLTWNVFNGMQGIFSYQHLGKLSQISQLHTQQIMNQKVAEVTKGYYSLVLAQKKQRTLENCLLLSQEVVQLAQAKYEVGEATKLDYLTAQVQYNDTQADLLLQEEGIAKAKLTLRTLLGKDAPDDFTIVEEAIPLPTTLTWESLLQAFKRTNVGILVAQKNYEDATLAVKITKATLWPQVDFKLGYTLGSQYQERHWKATPRNFHYGVAVSFNLFHAFEHHTAIQEAKIKVDTAKLHLEAQQVQLEAALKQQFLRYTQQLQRHALTQQYVEVSQENAALALEQYRLGKITLLEVEKARSNAQEAILKCLQALYEAKVTEAELQQLCGVYPYQTER